MAEINKQWKNFLTYGGIDGGDSDAKIWFVGIEWANTEDVKKSQNKHTDKIIPDISNEEEIKEWLTADCRLEHRMGIIINAIEQNISPNTGISLTKDLITAGKFFQANSGYAKLNLYPLAFSNIEKHGDIKELYPDAGFNNYQEYDDWCYANRRPMFLKLIKTAKPKAIVCFGKEYWEKFRDHFKSGKHIVGILDPKMKINKYRLDDGHEYALILLQFNPSSQTLKWVGEYIKKLLD